MKKKRDFTSGRKCALCGKGVQFANKVSHAKNRTKIVRKPNLHGHKMVIEGAKIRLKLCSKCKRSLRALEKREERSNLSKTETKK